MKAKDFYGEYRINDTKPKRAILSYIDAQELTEALERFIEANFGALAIVEYEGRLTGSIVISEEYTAYFLKQLLSFVFGRKFIKINISTSAEELTIGISAVGGLLLTAREIAALLKTASAGGFDADFSGRELTLKLKTHASDYSEVYAQKTASNAFYLSLCKLFFD